MPHAMSRLTCSENGLVLFLFFLVVFLCACDLQKFTLLLISAVFIIIIIIVIIINIIIIIIIFFFFK